MSANLTLHTSAVTALTELLPTVTPLSAAVFADRASLQGGAVSHAVTASFVGALSADLALVPDRRRFPGRRRRLGGGPGVPGGRAAPGL